MSPIFYNGHKSQREIEFKVQHDWINFDMKKNFLPKRVILTLQVIEVGYRIPRPSDP